MVHKIWVEPLFKDGTKWWGPKGLWQCARFQTPDGEVLVERSLTPLLDACRVLERRGVLGPFEMWQVGIPYACMTGIIERAARVSGGGRLMGQHIYIKPLMKPADLALRQLRMMAGLLREGLTKDEIRALQWYDPALEVYYPGTVTRTHTSTLERSHEIEKCDHPEVVDRSKITRSEKARLKRAKE